MKKKVFLLSLAVLLGFIGYIVFSTGYFRTIENKFDGKIIKKVNLDGAEDIVVSEEGGFAIISSTKRKNLTGENQDKGGLYLIDLQSDDFTPIHLTHDFDGPLAPHGISMFKKDSLYTIAAVNHTQEAEFIEFFEFDGKKLQHKKSLSHELIHSPNDVILIDENRFYVTNDHKYKKGLGRFSEDYLGLAISNVIYFDGKDFSEVASGIAYANGIAIDPKRKLCFVASPRNFLVKVYAINPDGLLTFIEDIDCNTGVDNIDIDKKGKLWIGCHPNLLQFSSYAKGNTDKSPSEIIVIDYKGKSNYAIDQIYMEDGTEMSASTVAVPFKNFILLGNVMDSHFLILERSTY